jgi:subtilase family serine protease
MTGVLMALAGPARATGPVLSRLGMRPPIPAGAQAVGALPQATNIPATVALAPRDPVGLAAYAHAVSTPDSASYHRYLTVAEFVERFGPSAAQVDAVRASLRARGLTVGALSANGLALSVGSTAVDLATAFQTSFERYRLPSGQLAYANTSAPSVPASIIGTVQGIVGLDTLDAPRPVSLSHTVAPAGAALTPQVATGGPQPCSLAKNAAASSRSYTADKLASAYRFSGAYAAGDLGGGVTIALFELEPHQTTDITAYQSCYATNASVANVPVDGGAGTGPGSGEAALDIENVIGLAPKANVLVYEGPNSNAGAYDTYNAIISQNRAQVISTSWGLCEASQGASTAAAENTLFEEAAVQGQSIFAASGDTGADDCRTATGPAVDDPASQPYVTGVGGTTLSSLGPPPTETVWGNSSGAGGGGISSLWTMPSYQSSAPSFLGVINARSTGSPCGSPGYCREVPDVSADADPNTGYEIYWSGRWQSFGGTSAAAPTWAALTVLADASSACAGAKVGFANAAIYRAAAAGYRSSFNDVTSGSNSSGGVPGFAALAGFDMASGLGSPSSLTAALCGSADAVTLANPGSQSATKASATRLQLTATSSAGTPITYAASNLPGGLAINPSSGLITGTPTATGTWTVDASASDASSSTGVTSFTWSVTAPVSLTPAGAALPSTIPRPVATSPLVTLATPPAERGRVGVSRRLQIHATDAGHFALTYSALGLPAGMSISSVSGLISGTPTRAARTTVTVRAGDGAGGLRTTTFTWTVAGRPRVRASSVRLLPGGHVRLWVTLLAGARAAGIKSVVVSVPRAVQLSLTPRDRKGGISAVSPSGRRLSNTSRLLHAALIIRLTRTTRNATVSLASPQLSLSRQLTANLTSHRVRTVKLVATSIDGDGITTRLSTTATVTTPRP